MAILPAKFSTAPLFPAVTLLQRGDSFRANFGQNKWRYNLSQLFQNNSGMK